MLADNLEHRKIHLCLTGSKKTAVRDNAVPVVLLLNVSTAAFIWSIPVTVSWFSGNGSSDGSGCGDGLAQLSRLTPGTHALLFSKSLLVGASWTCAFFALKHLPISVATPIRATSPLWTVLIAVTLFGERPGIAQWFGVGIVVAAFVAFSRVGAREGIHFTRDRFVTLMMVATLLGAVSAIYDKYLLQTAKLSPAVVQAWFSIYLVPVMLPLAFRWWRVERQTNPFQWRASIPLIAIFLLMLP